MAAGATYHAELADRLSRLGLAVESQCRSCPVRALSARRQEIEDEFAAAGIGTTSDAPQGARLQGLPRRLVVARTFGCRTRWKRLVRDHRNRFYVSEAMISVALESLILRRGVHQ
jgi:hypothetical protein